MTTPTRSFSLSAVDAFEFVLCSLCAPKTGAFDLCQSCYLNRKIVGDLRAMVHALQRELDAPIPMLIWCPFCGERHIDVVLIATPHQSHACQHCGGVWKPSKRPTIGVQFLDGYKDEKP